MKKNKIAIILITVILSVMLASCDHNGGINPPEENDQLTIDNILSPDFLTTSNIITASSRLVEEQDNSMSSMYYMQAPALTGFSLRSFSQDNTSYEITLFNTSITISVSISEDGKRYIYEANTFEEEINKTEPVTPKFYIHVEIDPSTMKYNYEQVFLLKGVFMEGMENVLYYIVSKGNNIQLEVSGDKVVSNGQISTLYCLYDTTASPAEGSPMLSASEGYFHTSTQGDTSVTGIFITKTMMETFDLDANNFNWSLNDKNILEEQPLNFSSSYFLYYFVNGSEFHSLYDNNESSEETYNEFRKALQNISQDWKIPEYSANA